MNRYDTMNLKKNTNLITILHVYNECIKFPATAYVSFDKLPGIVFFMRIDYPI